MPNTPTSYPVPSIRRLPVYLRLCQEVAAAGDEQISCTRIAETLSLDPTQVRKDLAMAGAVGKPRIGYVVVELIAAIQEFLGWNNVTDAFLVGAGHLGAALLGYDFRPNGIHIIAAFDTDPEKVGTKIHGVQVFHLNKLPNLARRLHVRIGILTVPPHAATEAAGVLCDADIRAIWNFSPASVDVPKHVILENVYLSTSLAVLCSRLKETMPERETSREQDAHSEYEAAPEHDENAEDTDDSESSENES